MIDAEDLEALKYAAAFDRVKFCVVFGPAGKRTDLVLTDDLNEARAKSKDLVNPKIYVRRNKKWQLEARETVGV